MEVTAEMVIAVITAIITFIFGKLSKKFNWIDSKYIPIQNSLIGICGGMLCYLLKVSDKDLFQCIMYCLFGSMSAAGYYDLTKTTKEDK